MEYKERASEEGKVLRSILSPILEKDSLGVIESYLAGPITVWNKAFHGYRHIIIAVKWDKEQMNVYKFLRGMIDIFEYPNMALTMFKYRREQDLYFLRMDSGPVHNFHKDYDGIKLAEERRMDTSTIHKIYEFLCFSTDFVNIIELPKIKGARYYLSLVGGHGYMRTKEYSLDEGKDYCCIEQSFRNYIADFWKERKDKGCSLTNRCTCHLCFYENHHECEKGCHLK